MSGTILDTKENLVAYLKSFECGDAEIAISELECAAQRFTPESFFELHVFNNNSFSVVVPNSAIFNF